MAHSSNISSKRKYMLNHTVVRIAIIPLTSFIVSLAILMHTSLAYSQPRYADWYAWVAKTRQQAIAYGIHPETFDRAFEGIYPDKKTIRLDRTQPEKRLTFLEYRQSRGDPYRIKLGKRYCKKHRPLLNEISNQYGIAPRYIVTFWGMESSYGHFMGNFSVIKSLATLAYDGRRRDFFKNQLFAALQIVQEGHINLRDFKGEWAGGTGQSQFLPTSWQHYAVDYNGDGHKDIWKTKSDVFASIANYLVEHGWRQGEPWGYEVRLPRHFSPRLLGEAHQQSVADWQAAGVRTIDGRDLPNSHLIGWIIEPDGGPAHLVFNNFNVFKAYNNSTFYAGTIGYLSDRICQ